MLLADAHEKFLSTCSLLSNTSLPPTRSANWLLLNAYQVLYPHLRSKRHLSKKQGTVLLQNGGDPVAALHTALAEYRTRCLRLEKQLEKERKIREQNSSTVFSTTELVSTCMSLNSKLQAAASQLSKVDLDRVKSLDLNDVMLCVDPVLWNVTTLLTLSPGE